MKHILPALFCLCLACLPAHAQEQLIPYPKNGKWGYCNAEKKIVIPCLYGNAGFFVDGLARVADTTIAGGYVRWGYINTQGKLVIPFQYEWAHDFREGLAYVEWTLGEGGRAGAIINKEGKFVFPPKIQTPPIPLPMLETPIFSEGLLPLHIIIKQYQESAYGYIDRTGKEIIKTNLGYAGKFSEGLAAASKLEDTYKYGFINKVGKFIIPPLYTRPSDFSEGLASVYLDELCGCIDKTGKTIIPFQYESIGDFNEGLATAVKAGKAGFLDKTGKVAIPFVYDAVYSFSEGLAAVSQNDKVGFINRAGKIIIPFEYSSKEQTHTLLFKNSLVIMAKNGKLGAIDYTGKVVIPFRYADLGNAMEGIIDFSTGFIPARLGEDDYFILDKNGVEYKE